jgi:NagD protein
MAEHKNYLIDMDGVLIAGTNMIPGADGFILPSQGLRHRIPVCSPTIPSIPPVTWPTAFSSSGWTFRRSASLPRPWPRPRFLQSQKPNGTAYVIGESGLTEAVHSVGYVITDHDPDYVVLGETHSYNLSQITKAIRLVAAGARFIATNPDANGPSETGLVPACGAMAALIETAQRPLALFRGQAQPPHDAQRPQLSGGPFRDHHHGGRPHGYRHDRWRRERHGYHPGPLRRHPREDVGRYPYQPTRIVDSVADIEP